jgi:hypothetical protein
LLALILFPVMDNSGGGRLLYAAVGAVVVGAGAVGGQSQPGGETGLPGPFAAPAISLTLAALLLGRGDLLAWSSVFESGAVLLFRRRADRYMLHDHEVTGDELFAAGATFTLLAWGFAYAYFVCQSWYPASFGAMLSPDSPRTWTELLFLSFTTLSGVGLGDILPLSPPARVLVMLEEFAGVGYIAAIVSRLIGLTIRDRR